MIDKTIAHIDAGKDRNTERLFEFLRMPSISTDPQRKADIRRSAEWVHKFFKDCGITADIIETAGHPSVIADTGPVDGDGPTVLVYGHYDVQPTGDEKLWHSPAFEPTVRDGRVYARGSADDKGQVFAHMLALESWRKTAGRTPVRVKYLIEGEEEIGSKNLPALIREHKDRLACQYVALSDTAKLDHRTPAITYGTKGLVYMEIRLTGPKQDMHSGAFGGTVVNPGNALAQIIHSMRDADNRVTIPGFYDDVRPLADEERKAFAQVPFKDEEYRQLVGAPALMNEKGYSVLECRWARPTLDVNGILGGFVGEGQSTIIPSKMMAKVSMRIVPDQDPEKIAAAFEKHVRAAAPKGVTVEVLNLSRAPAYMCPIDSPGMRAAAEAVEKGFGATPVRIREGGTLPILPLFKKELGAESIMMGFCTPDCNLHGPNEFFVLSDFLSGTKAAAHFLDCLSRAK